MSFHRSVFQPGARIGRATVISRRATFAEDSGGYVKFDCDCGGVFSLTAQRAREIAQVMSLACRTCREKDRGKASLRKRARSKTCGHCGVAGHNKRECPKRPSKHEGRHCLLCCGQSWCVEGMKCARCGLDYAPEPPVTLDYVMALPRESRTVFPGMTGGFRL